MKTGGVTLLALAMSASLTGVLTGCAGNLSQMRTDPERAYIDACTVLRQAAESQDALVRVHAVEALAQTLGPEVGELYAQSLTDPHPGVRFAGAMAIGDVRFSPGKRKLLEMVENPETDKNVLVAALYALHRLGNDKYTGLLADLLTCEESGSVRANAAMAMGKMDEPSAKEPLKARLANERTPMVQLQIREALARIGDAASAELLEAHAKSPFLDEQLAAIPVLADVRPANAVRVLRWLLSSRHPPRVRVSAAGALAKMGQTGKRTYEYALSAVRRPDKIMRKSYAKVRKVSVMEIYSLQRLAAISLGWMKQDSAVDSLVPLLRSQDGGVRVASAMSIIRLLSSYRTAPTPAGGKADEEQPSPTTRPEMHSAGGKD